MRRFEKEMAELKQLQAERFDRERREIDEAARLYLAAKQENKPFDPAEFGFDFSMEDVEAYLKRRAMARTASTRPTQNPNCGEPPERGLISRAEFQLTSVPCRSLTR